jgi:hypothetical protein
MLPAAVLMTGVGGCAAYPQFEHSRTSRSEYLQAVIVCRAKAEQLNGAYDQEAERYEAGSDEEMIGGAIGASLSEKLAKREIYLKCMKAAGYKKI